MKKFWCYCYILFQLFWTHSQSLPCHGDKPCVNFCCAKNFVMRDNMCKIANETEYVTKIHQHCDNYTHVHTKLQCEGGKTYLYPRDHWRLTVNGIIINGELYELDNYCIEQTEHVAIICHNQFPTATLILNTLSIVCIVIIIVCNVACDELRNNHVAYIKIPFLFFLALSYLIEVLKSKFRESLLTNFTGCIITALLFQFSALSALFWLTCISVEVWLRFRQIDNIQATEVSRNHLYYPVSILGPTIITIVTMILQFVADQEEAKYIHPRF